MTFGRCASSRDPRDAKTINKRALLSLFCIFGMIKLTKELFGFNLTTRVSHR